MKFDIYADVLSRALTTAALGLPKNSMTPVLSNFLFQERAGKLWIIATKGIMTVGVEVPEVDLEPLSYRIIFNAKDISKIAKASADSISFDCSPRKAVIRTNKSEWVLNLQDASEYPEINSLNISSWQEVAREPFIESLNSVASAASFDPQMPALNAVNISDNTFVAANGMCLQRVRSDFGYPDMNIPSHAITEVISVLKTSNEDSFKVRPAKNGIGLKVGTAILIITSLSTEYPDVSSAILKPTLINEDIVDVEKTEILAAIQRCTITTDDSNKIVAMELLPGKIRLSSKNQQGSHSFEDIETYWAEEDTKIKVVVRSEQLTNAIKSCPIANMALYFGREENTRLPSVLIKADDAQYAAVVTQIRTDLL